MDVEQNGKSAKELKREKKRQKKAILLTPYHLLGIPCLLTEQH